LLYRIRISDPKLFPQSLASIGYPKMKLEILKLAYSINEF
jgi:hypothetical protein